MHAGVKSAFKAGAGLGSFWFAIFLAYAIGFYWGGYAIRNQWTDSTGHYYTSGQVVTIFFSVVTGMLGLGMAAPALRSIGEGIAAAKLLFLIIESTPAGVPTPSLACSPRGGINMHNVHFSYPSRPDCKVLRGVSLNFREGETTAIVGATGSGKSTILSLLLRFYEPGEGSITIGEDRLDQIDTRLLRERVVSYVGQEPVLFNASILENIRFGKSDATEVEVEEALKKVKAWDFIQALPDGIHTSVGERGSQLSGG